MTWEERVFERLDVSLTKHGHENRVFLEILSFFTKYKHESSDFFVQNRKKRHPIDFFGPEYT